MPSVSARKEHTLFNGMYARSQLAKFALSLKQWRAAQKLSRGALAEKVGCSGQQIANIEHRENYPSFPVYAALCREMGVEPVPGFPTDTR